MAKNLDQIVVIDLEATCWESNPPPGEENEIIEIGVCTLEVATGQRLDKESILVKPERSRVSEFCTRLTTLTQAQVEVGISFKQACSLLKTKYQTKDRLWASFGDYDRKQFERQCTGNGIGYPFGPGHINVKSLLAVTKGFTQEVGMDEALRRLNLPLIGTHHRGIDDAWNIAGILGYLLLAGRKG